MPRCYVPRDEFRQLPDGSWEQAWEGGWHYSTRVDENGNEIPDRKLHLNDSAQFESDWYYELAEEHHQSWLSKHGVGNLVPIHPLPYGAEHPPIAHADHPEHARWLKEVTEQNG